MGRVFTRSGKKNLEFSFESVFMGAVDRGFDYVGEDLEKFIQNKFDLMSRENLLTEQSVIP